MQDQSQSREAARKQFLDDCIQRRSKLTVYRKDKDGLIIMELREPINGDMQCTRFDQTKN